MRLGSTDGLPNPLAIQSHLKLHISFWQDSICPVYGFCFSDHSSISVHLGSADGPPNPLLIQPHLKLPISFWLDSYGLAHRFCFFFRNIHQFWCDWGRQMVFRTRWPYSHTWNCIFHSDKIRMAQCMGLVFRNIHQYRCDWDQQMVFRTRWPYSHTWNCIFHSDKIPMAQCMGLVFRNNHQYRCDWDQQMVFRTRWPYSHTWNYFHFRIGLAAPTYIFFKETFVNIFTGKNVIFWTFLKSVEAKAVKTMIDQVYTLTAEANFVRTFNEFWKEKYRLMFAVFFLPSLFCYVSLRSVFLEKKINWMTLSEFFMISNPLQLEKSHFFC